MRLPGAVAPSPPLLTPAPALPVPVHPHPHPYPCPYPSPGTPHQVEAQGQRVCPACNTACRKAPFVVPADRVRMLSELIGTV